MNTKDNRLGIMLKNYRKKAGFTQQSLSKEFKYATPQFVSNWERGLCRPPVKTLAKLSVKLKFPFKVIKELLVAEYSKELDQAYSNKGSR